MEKPRLSLSYKDRVVGCLGAYTTSGYSHTVFCVRDSRNGHNSQMVIHDLRGVGAVSEDSRE